MLGLGLGLAATTTLPLPVPVRLPHTQIEREAARAAHAGEVERAAAARLATSHERLSVRQQPPDYQP